MSYGPNPWQQAHWDWRAASNFIAGGAGSGLIVFAVLSGAPPAVILAGLALVGLGLTCVWLEIGRPLRALNVFLHPRRSWMSREAIVAVLLMATCVAAALPDEIFGWIACALALAFAYCQARMLCAARGIPAWREPLVVPLIVVTALAEGGGLLLVAGPWLGAANRSLVLALGVLLLVRWLTWLAYRRRLRTATGGGAALDRAGRVLQLAGSLAPLALLGASALMGDAGAPFAALAGLMAAGAGAYTKLLLITRAGYNQGFALARLPVRGVRP